MSRSMRERWNRLAMRRTMDIARDIARPFTRSATWCARLSPVDRSSPRPAATGADLEASTCSIWLCDWSQCAPTVTQSIHSAPFDARPDKATLPPRAKVPQTHAGCGARSRIHAARPFAQESSEPEDPVFPADHFSPCSLYLDISAVRDYY